MKKILIFCISCMVLGSVGCTSEGKIKKEYTSLIEETQNDLFPVLNLDDSVDNTVYEEELLDDGNDTYQKEIWNMRGKKLKMPAGLLCRENDLIIVDKGNDSLIVSDYEGNMVRSVGNTGNGALEFMTPTGIALYEDKIYVIDSGNQRIQILSQELEYIEEIKISNEDDPSIIYENIAVDSDYAIYLCGDSLKSRSVDKWEDGKIRRIEENFYGSIYGEDGKVYAINRGNIGVDPEKLEMTVIAGENSLFQIEGDHFIQICELPKGLVINAFVLREGEIVCSSNKLAKLFVFDMNGRYKETVSGLKELKADMDLRNYLSINEDQEVFFSNPQTGEIFVMRK